MIAPDAKSTRFDRSGGVQKWIELKNPFAKL